MTTVAEPKGSRLWRQIDSALEPGSGGRAARLFRLCQGLLLVVGLGVVVCGTVPAIDADYDIPLTGAALAVSLFFAIEYLVRICRAPAGPAEAGSADGNAAEVWHRRLQWALSPLALIDLVAAAPIPLAMGLGISPATTRLFGVFWVLKLVRSTQAFGLLVRVVRNEARALSSVMVAFLIALLVIATIAYLLERNSGAVGFDSIPGALWWTIVTVSTTGYGDEIPATFAGRVLGGVAMICGIAMFALWAGILASAFAQEMRRRDFLETWGLVARVPLFGALGAGTIAEVAGLLRPCEMAEGRAVVRRGQPGDSMYFIASGEVEVHTESGPVKIGAGGFFGEMALISGARRSATVTTTQRTTLLKLDIVDFRSLVAREPELIKTINSEAARRGQGAPTPAAERPDG